MRAWGHALVHVDADYVHIVFVGHVETTLQQLQGDVSLGGYVVVNMQTSDSQLADLPVSRCFENKLSQTATHCPTMLAVVRDVLMQQTSRFQNFFGCTPNL